MRVTKKSHNHILQTKPRDNEEETYNTDRYNTIKLKQSSLTFSARRLQSQNGHRELLTKQGPSPLQKWEQQQKFNKQKHNLRLKTHTAANATRGMYVSFVGVGVFGRVFPAEPSPFLTNLSRVEFTNIINCTSLFPF